MTQEEKRRKVSFSATPQVKFIDHASSSKTGSSITLAEESMELTTDYTNVIDENRNESETIDLGNVINTINTNDEERENVMNLTENKENLGHDIERCLEDNIERFVDQSIEYLEQNKENSEQKETIIIDQKKRNSTVTFNLELSSTNVYPSDIDNKLLQNTVEELSETIDFFDDGGLEEELFNKNDDFDKLMLKDKEDTINDTENIVYNLNNNEESNVLVQQDDIHKTIPISYTKICDPIQGNAYKSKPNTFTDDCLPSDSFYTTKDLKKIIPSTKINIMEVLEKHKIKFVDKNTITKRKTIIRQNEVKPELVYYYKYFACEFYNHFNSFISYLENEIQKKQENILRLENESYDITGFNFNGIKKNCRIFAMNEWYLRRIERENEFNNKLQENKNKLNEKLKRSVLSEELNEIRRINEELELKINELIKCKENERRRDTFNDNIAINGCTFKENDRGRDKYNESVTECNYKNNDKHSGKHQSNDITYTISVDATNTFYANTNTKTLEFLNGCGSLKNIRNYFKKNNIFSESFVDENLSYKNLIEGKMENFLETEIKNRKNKEKEKRNKKEKLEKEIKEINKEIEKENGKRKNVTLKEMEIEKKKMDLFLKMNKIKIEKICKENVKFVIGNFVIEEVKDTLNNESMVKNDAGCISGLGKYTIAVNNLGFSMKNSEYNKIKIEPYKLVNDKDIIKDSSLVANNKNIKDFYDFELSQIDTKNFRNVFMCLNEINLLYKEIKDLNYEYENNCFTVKIENKVTKCNLNEIEILENGRLLYKGVRKYGMIQSMKGMEK